MDFCPIQNRFSSCVAVPGRCRPARRADYHVPVSADVASLEALVIDEHDPHVNALGIMGVGEIRITGTAGAVANAVWHATGIRVRRFPIRIDDFVMPASG
jgi:xanthine dehydrogenase YagR molybdenum-binding subunit